MTHPIFDEIPEQYHDRVIVDVHDNATIDVQSGAFEVPVIYEADRRAMNLPPGLHHDRRRLDAPEWYPPSY